MERSPHIIQWKDVSEWYPKSQHQEAPPPRDRSQLTKVEHAQAELPLPVAVVDISVVNKLH